MDDMNGVYPHLLVQLLAVVLGWMDPEADFKLNISPRLESILVAIILNNIDTGINKNSIFFNIISTFNKCNIYEYRGARLA
jgi:hypothetical protein